jgi:hypothetical protein
VRKPPADIYKFLVAEFFLSQIEGTNLKITPKSWCQIDSLRHGKSRIFEWRSNTACRPPAASASALTAGALCSRASFVPATQTK